MRMVELFVPMTAMITFAVIIGLVTRLIATGMLHRTIREAMRSDPASVALLAGRLEARQPWADAVLGWIFIAFTAGFALLALTDPDADDRIEMLRAAIIPLVIGVTVLVYTRFAARKAARDLSTN
jgi:quinol-cytochrome oxidoreductase complex cytochrome b subunit